MRLIDADALKESIEVYFADGIHLYDAFSELIDEQPTIKPERKKRKTDNICPVCKRTMPISPYACGFPPSYCTYCGAYMGGEQDETD